MCSSGVRVAPVTDFANDATSHLYTFDLSSLDECANKPVPGMLSSKTKCPIKINFLLSRVQMLLYHVQWGNMSLHI
jgi:hypothetical protein